MSYRVTGLGAFGYSINWEKVECDGDIARRVIIFLEDRRLLFQPYLSEHVDYCVESALQIRRFLTDELSRAQPGSSLDQSLRGLRAATRAFVDAAGSARKVGPFGGVPFFDDFSVALGELRSRAGSYVALIAYHYDIEVEDELAQILPPPIDDDPSIVPGFEE